jgi:hypothetical protein
MESHKDKKTIIAMLVLGFIGGLVVGRLFPKSVVEINQGVEVSKENDEVLLDNTNVELGDTSGDTITNDNSDILSGTGEGITVVQSEYTISVEDQLPAKVVNIARLALSKRSWVVIHEDYRGRPGNILGAHRYMEGVHENVPVELQRSMEQGGVYYIMLHHNDNDDEFDFTKDLPLTNEDGALIMTRFVAVE